MFACVKARSPDGLSFWIGVIVVVVGSGWLLEGVFAGVGAGTDGSTTVTEGAVLLASSTLFPVQANKMNAITGNNTNRFKLMSAKARLVFPILDPYPTWHRFEAQHNFMELE